ncbi:unnamed protein product [Penicillium camemberti]|uniref:Str. FM013 n=1 Tax=Penicillium camemberti (strain FM 013) TaxID=1429867 RepID=A0A0G4P208_PENC3|nr:unnamed protein product [Penicillium camemberti]
MSVETRWRPSPISRPLQTSSPTAGRNECLAPNHDQESFADGSRRAQAVPSMEARAIAGARVDVELPAVAAWFQMTFMALVHRANPEVLQLINSAAGGGLTYESDGLHRFLSSMDRRLCCEPVWMAF